MSGPYRAPLADLRFLLESVLGCDELLALPVFAHVDQQVINSVLNEGARFAEEILAPINATGDLHGSRLEDDHVILPPEYHSAWQRLTADGWIGLDLPAELGGQHLPRVVQSAFAEMANGACMAFCMLPLMCRAGVRLLIEHGAPDVVDEFAPRLAAGDWGATICISEPEAGSDVGRIRCLAKPAPDGSYRLSGTKIWISYGDHGLTPQIAHFVLARTPDAAPGTRGLSLFLVPKIVAGAANGVRANSVEKKMGLKASPTCVMEFDEAVAYPIGAERRGLNSLFTMVNTMRLEVASQGVAIAGAATARALAYAGERRQGGLPAEEPVLIVEHPDVRRMLMIMRARTEAMRALILEAAIQLDLADHAIDAATRRDAATLATWLLPICKACGSDTGLDVANLAIQVFGGAGYVHETGVEQYVRDIRVGSIYEGTNGIQALDLVTRKLLRDEGAGLELFSAKIRQALKTCNADANTQDIYDALADGVVRLERCSRFLRARRSEPRHVAAGATPYLQLAGLVGGAWMWLRMAAASTDATPLHRTKQVCASFYAHHLMPEAATLETRIVRGAADLDRLDTDTLTDYR